MKRVLVTGASGFIGRHTLRHLLEAGFEVHSVGRGQPQEAGNLGVVHHSGDLFDPKSVHECMTSVRPSHLLHLAWYVEHGKFWTSLENLRWVQASLELLLAFVANGGRRCAGAGTCAEYDWSTGSACREDDTPLRPGSLYATCKAALFAMQTRLAVETGIGSAWCRIFNIYGPWEAPGRLVSGVARGLLLSRPVPCSAGEQERDFLYVDDVARAIVTVLDSDFSGAVNVASGSPVPVRDVVQVLAELAGRPDLPLFGALPAAAGEPPTLCGDPSRLRSLGFVPRFSLRNGLAQTLDWWRTRL